jgi:CheY-like chemotaxis protein
MQPAQAHTNTQRPLRVIVADDHKMIREQIIHVVARGVPEAVIVAVNDGLQALEEFRAAGADVLVTNNHMPRLDGPALIRQLREENVTIPIIAVSMDPRAEAGARQAGTTAFLAKEEIFERLPELLRAYSAGR